MGCSSANTAIVHAGYDPSGSLKAFDERQGKCHVGPTGWRAQLPFERRGDYVVAVGDEELPW